MKTKKAFTFTLNGDLLNWFKSYAEKEQRSMSSIINTHILELKNNYKGSLNVPINALKVTKNN